MASRMVQTSKNGGKCWMLCRSVVGWKDMVRLVGVVHGVTVVACGIFFVLGRRVMVIIRLGGVRLGVR